jgi:CBS domain-containing protein
MTWEDDLFSEASASPRAVAEGIGYAESAAQLQHSSHEIRGLAQQMLEQGAGAAQVTRTMSMLNDLLTRRIIDLEFGAKELGDVEFCWISMGSVGRHEQTFTSDQDNGIVFVAAAAVCADAVRQRLLAPAQHANQRLAECGFALCRGGIMASNPQCCLSLTEWQQRFAEWIDRGDPKALLNATIFFDFRPLHGALEAAQELREWLRRYAMGNSRFLLQLTENALTNTPPLGLLRDFVFADSTHLLDFKVNGVTPFVDAARILALSAGVTETNTARRLQRAAPALKIDAADAQAWIEAFHWIQLLRLRHQSALARSGQPVSNLVDPDHLNELDRRILKEAMRQARKLQQRLARERSLNVTSFGV